MSLRVTDDWATWIEEALPTLVMGNPTRYDMTLVISEQGPAIIVVLFSPGIIIGSTMHSVAVVPNPGGVTKETLEHILTGMVGALADERSRQAQMPPEAQIAAPAPSENGASHLRSIQ